MLALMQNLVETDPQEVPVQQAANATIVDNVQLQMLQILQAMQDL